MTYILNAMQHNLTEVQIYELSERNGGQVQILELRIINDALFSELANSPSDKYKLEFLAKQLAIYISQIAVDAVILPIGSPAFMFAFALECAANTHNAECLFAHSVRNSVETINPDGTVTKTQVFKHVKFIKFSP